MEASKISPEVRDQKKTPLGTRPRGALGLVAGWKLAYLYQLRMGICD